MNAFENTLVALRAVRANPLRAGLTMLGIIIGVASVIVMLALAEGARAKVAEQIRSLGSNLLVIHPGSTTEGIVQNGAGTNDHLTTADAAALSTGVPQVVVAAPSVAGTGQIVRGNANWNTLVAGVTPDYLVARDWKVEKGRPLTHEDERRAEKVVVLGRTVAQRLFGSKDPVGQSVRLEKVPFTVVGVLGEKGAGAGRDQDDVALLPLSSAVMRVVGTRSEVRRDAVDFILVKAASEEDIGAVREGVRHLLRHRHRRGTDAPDGFLINEPAEAMGAQATATQSLTLLLLAVASVSVVVGGISIMNIMLVSVTERTREIGLRQALGARPSDVRNQFLIEAVTLCFIGGLLGIVLGWSLAGAAASAWEWPLAVSLSSVLIALAFSSGTGLVFGYFPASRAAALTPVEALRFE